MLFSSLPVDRTEKYFSPEIIAPFSHWIKSITFLTYRLADSHAAERKRQSDFFPHDRGHQFPLPKQLESQYLILYTRSLLDQKQTGV